MHDREVAVDVLCIGVWFTKQVSSNLYKVNLLTISSAKRVMYVYHQSNLIFRGHLL